MRIRGDGSIQSSGTPTPANSGRRDDYAIYRCIITKVAYTDDPSNVSSNSTNARVLYEAVVLGGFSSGQIISNIRLSSDLGGESGFYERILRACSNDISTSRLSDADGDIVFVAFTQGHTSYPIIIALDNGIHTNGLIGAKLNDGPRMIREYNGVRHTINKDGELIEEIKGGSATPEKGKFIANTSPLVTSVTSKDEKYTKTFKSGLIVSYDGKGDTASITTAGGAIINVDGKGGKITLTKGATIIELDGTSDKISLKGGFVDIGASVSDFAVLFTELLTAFNTHTHIAPQAPTGALPTTPPVAPMLQIVGSQTVKVQA